MAASVSRPELAAMIASRVLPPEHQARLTHFLDFIDKVQGVVPPPQVAPTRHNPPLLDQPNTFVPTPGFSHPYKVG